MIVTQDKTTALYSYQNGIGANTEAILNRTLRHILYGDLYDDGGNGGTGGEIPLTGIITATGLTGTTISTASITAIVDTELTGNLLYNGTSLTGVAPPNSTITVEVI